MISASGHPTPPHIASIIARGPPGPGPGAGDTDSSECSVTATALNYIICSEGGRAAGGKLASNLQLPKSHFIRRQKVVHATVNLVQ